MRLAWVTDPHFDHAGSWALRAFRRRLQIAAPDVLLVSGDIGTADSVASWLAELRADTPGQVLFCLGNHDCYGDRIRAVRFRVAGLAAADPALVYLSRRDVVPLTPDLAVVGHDGWADGDAGDYVGSPGDPMDHPVARRALEGMPPAERRAQFETLARQVPLLRQIPRIADYHAITDFVDQTPETRRALLQALAREAAAHIAHALAVALPQYAHVIVVTHVPPFAEAAWHEGRLSSGWHLPHFASPTMGAVLCAAADAYPHRTIEVLCGHTHGAGVISPRPNLIVRTGGAVYGEPDLQFVRDLP